MHRRRTGVAVAKIDILAGAARPVVEAHPEQTRSLHCALSIGPRDTVRIPARFWASLAGFVILRIIAGFVHVTLTNCISISTDTHNDSPGVWLRPRRTMPSAVPPNAHPAP